MSDEDNTHARKAATIMTENSGSIDRMKVAAHLINVCNFAILTQAGRPQWNEHDARCFSIALAAINQIGDFDGMEVPETKPQPRLRPVPQQRQQSVEELSDEIEQGLQEMRPRQNGSFDSRMPQHRLS
jgi:hypothetical protein